MSGSRGNAFWDDDLTEGVPLSVTSENASPSFYNTSARYNSKDDSSALSDLANDVKTCQALSDDASDNTASRIGVCRSHTPSGESSGNGASKFDNTRIDCASSVGILMRMRDNTHTDLTNRNNTPPNDSLECVYRDCSTRKGTESSVANSNGVKTSDTQDEVKIFCGTFAHSTNVNPMEILEDKILGVAGNKILFLEESVSMDAVLEKHDVTEYTVLTLNDSQFMLPGFIDTHTHAPQFPNLGTSLDKGLCEWLEAYTYPTEAKFEDLKFARKVYEQVVERLLRNGTCTATYFGTIHTDATQVLCDVIECKGQRAFVGKVNMDQHCPEFYRETTTASLQDTERFIKNVTARRNRLLTPVITPRFAVNCSRELLRQLGGLARLYDIPIQTHISECRQECKMVSDIYTECDNYADVYDRHGLLTDKTILAHGVWLTEKELNTIQKRKCGIAHCANSNLSLRSGILDARRLLDHGIKVGLGTDISAGYSPSMLNAMRTSLQVSNARALSESPDYRCLTYTDVFKMATLGGAQVLGLDEVTGSFQPGKDFDAIIVDCDVPSSPFDCLPCDDTKRKLQRFIYQGDDRNITSVFVAGRKVK